jgi:hypothetical protein
METTFERLQEIEHNREQVMNDPKFQQWMKELNVSQSYQEMTGIWNARELMNQYDYSKYQYKLSA